MSQPSPAVAVLSGKRGFLICLGLLVTSLVVLFSANLDPDRVSFSNDGPLGAVNSSSRAVPGVLAGAWQDLNWVGGPEPIPAPNASMLLRLITSPVALNKLYAPTSLLIVGLCAWFFFRKLEFAPWACIAGGLAATLNADFFNTACWGVCSQPIAFGMNYLALGALADTTSPRRWLRVVLAGFAVGLGVTEAYDIGALFSLIVAAFIVVQALVSDGPPVKRLLNGLGRLALVGICAGIIAAAALVTLVGTQVKGVVGMGQDAESKAARWSQATQFSIPKVEPLGMLVPGLFGFRAETPNGGSYWGRAGSDPSWDEYVGTGGKSGRPGGAFRAGAGSNYAGVLVILVAVFGVAQSLRKQGGPFPAPQRKLIWFWSAVVGVGLLLMFGRFAPFYQFFYALPYASTIRNPAKFLHVVEWALVILFAYGAEALCRVGLNSTGRQPAGLSAHWKAWWMKVAGFDRRWVKGSMMALAAFGLVWLIFASSRGALEKHLVEMTRLEYQGRGQNVDFSAAAEVARATAGASVRQVGRTLLFLFPSVALVALTLSGYFRGPRANVGGVLFGLLLLTDLVPVNTAWVVSVNWKVKYETNSVIEFLRAQPYERRVAIFPLDRFVNLNSLPLEARPLVNQYYSFADLYGFEWTQHLFQYYDIQSLDIVQEPRVAADKAAFEAVMAFAPLRRWELTNTRYLVGPIAVLDMFNQQIDTAKKRLRVAARFDLVAKPGRQESSGLEQVTTAMNTNGQLAVFDFTGALPRAKLYANWKVSTNAPAQLQDWVTGIQSRLPREMGSALAAQSLADLATLKELADPAFDPGQTVLLAEPIPVAAGTNQSVGDVSFVSYAPKHIVLKARTESPAVLLLNDKYDPAWQVSVDGKPASLLRCNFIMRGVQVPPGEHQIEFQFAPSRTGLYVSFAALVLGAALLGLVVVSGRRENNPATLPAATPENRTAPRK